MAPVPSPDPARVLAFGVPTGPLADSAPAASDGQIDRSQALVGLLATLQAEVTRYVERRRDEGAPVARVIPEVRALVRAATGELAAPDADASPATMDAVAQILVAQTIRWSLRAYFAPPPPRYRAMSDHVQVTSILR